ncbi:hypothetical protein CPB83DRAFT_883154 [Crepidotus variabilis]|uniref:Uncharacterized protein n=1 Tax=Crepidotus variabilis TaxID=179855 RepID=A0A9P6JQK3_9AGAR|nr:hypothetical protein CPB83DRAFT_883154 [Crepidotus variabilis]
MPHLPFELYQKIVHELHHDPDTLKVTSPASRTFSFLCQQLLFSSIIIRSPIQCCSEYYKFGGPSSAFKNLLQSSPHIGGYVRCIEIFDWPGWTSAESLGCPRHPRWTVKAHWIRDDLNLQFCLPLLKQLEAFTLTYRRAADSDLIWNDLPPSLVSAIQRVLQLSSLIYVDMEHTPLLSLMQHADGNIKHLVIHNETRDFALENTAVSVANRPAVHLESLCIQLPCLIKGVEEALFDSGFLKSNISLRHLKKLALNLDGTLAEHVPVSNLLQECASSLEEIIVCPGLDASEVDPDLHNLQPVDLSKMKSLKLLSVFLEFSNEGIGFIYNQVPWFTNLLRSCSKTNEALEEIIVTFDIEYKPEDDLLGPWNAVADVILDVKYPKLRLLKITFISRYSQGANVVALFEMSDFVKRLRSKKDFVVELQHCFRSTPFVSYFIPNPSWLRLMHRQQPDHDLANWI